MDGIINEVQKKLDDKALDLLCSLYSRSTVKLFPQDISFIQPKSRKPKTRLCLPIPELFKDSCQALSVYFLQLLGTFTIKPLYSSPEVQHFKVCACTTYQQGTCMQRCHVHTLDVAITLAIVGPTDCTVVKQF